jgi:AcrR family transcriptional regulator
MKVKAETDKRSQIIDTAEELFSRKGFKGTSVREIAGIAGINIAMISYYFGSKEKLMEAVFEKRTDNIRFRVESLLQDEKLAPLEKVNILIDHYVERVIEEPRFHQLMLREQMQESNSVIKNSLVETKKRNLDIIKKLITDGQKKNAFRKNIDVVMMMNTMTGTVMQTITSLSQFRALNNLQDMSDSELKKYLKKKLSVHLKMLFKAILTYEK